MIVLLVYATNLTNALPLLTKAFLLSDFHALELIFSYAYISPYTRLLDIAVYCLLPASRCHFCDFAQVRGLDWLLTSFSTIAHCWLPSGYRIGKNIDTCHKIAVVIRLLLSQIQGRLLLYWQAMCIIRHVVIQNFVLFEFFRSLLVMLDGEIDSKRVRDDGLQYGCEASATWEKMEVQ